MDEQNNLQSNEPIQSSKNIWIIVITVVVTALIVGGGVYAWQRYTPQSTQQNSPTEISEYKKFEMMYYARDIITTEIPEIWSMYKNPENLGRDNLSDSPTASIGAKDVRATNFNWQQIDLFYVINDISKSLIEKAKETKYGTWSKETVGGIEADVVTYPLDNGEVTKAGTGGKKYFLSLPNIYDVRTLVISKQAKGDEEFENEFAHFIETLKFKKN